jgi:hypothetical protein
MLECSCVDQESKTLPVFCIGLLEYSCIDPSRSLSVTDSNNNALYFRWVTGFTQSNFRPGPTF